MDISTSPKTTSTPLTQSPTVTARLMKMVVYSVFLLAAVGVFLLQDENTGFWSGYTQHGWVSSHGLAIIRKATLDNGFVGHALAYREEDGSVNYVYFDRYPVFFSAGFNAILAPIDDLSTQVMVARQVMNFIFVATVFVAYLLLYELLDNRAMAMGLALLGFSSFYLQTFKDMVHFDQPALFGMVLLIYTIALHKLRGRRRPVYMATLVAVALGRGYASFAVLGIWATLEALPVLFRRGVPFRQRVTTILQQDAARVAFLGAAWGALLLGYNVVIEAVTNGVPITETSIVDSALRRVFSVGDNDALGFTWTHTFNILALRGVIWSIPGKHAGGEPISHYWTIALPALAVTAFAIFRAPKGKRTVLAVMVVAPIVWLALMKNMFVPHEYTAMYMVTIPLALYAGVALTLKFLRPLGLAVLLIGALTFVRGANLVRLDRAAELADPIAVTQDYENIAAGIEGEGRNIYAWRGRGVVPGRPYAFGFYLPSHYFAPLEIADYAVSNFAAQFYSADDGETYWLTTTPDNQSIFLFDTRSPRYPGALPGAAPLFNFGAAFSLYRWELTGSVEVSACETVTLVTWWGADPKPEGEYGMLLALVGEDGLDIAKESDQLTDVLARRWETDRLYLDASRVTVPCDAAPGEYPLILGLYDQDTGEALPVTLPDGTPQGGSIYLTTLFVGG